MRTEYRSAFHGGVTALLEAATPDVLSGERPGRYRIRIICPGQGSSGTYSEANLAASVGHFPAGTQMFMDHPSKDEDVNRPERSVKDLAGRLVTDAVVGLDGALYAECEVYPSFNDIIREKWQDIGVSINAWSENGLDADGIVPVFDGVTSVDFVTKAGAGGALLEVLESQRVSSDEENHMNEETIRQAIATAVTEALAPLLELLAKDNLPGEQPVAPEAPTGEAPGEDPERKPEEPADKPEAPEPTPERKPEEPGEKTDNKPPATSGEKKPEDDEDEKKRKARKESAAEAFVIATRLLDSGLPSVAQKRVIDAVESGTELKEAISAEQHYLTSVRASTAGEIRESSSEPYKIKNFK